MKAALILLVGIVPGSALALPNPEPAVGLWYGKWALALAPIILGLFFHVFTLGIAAFFVSRCLRQGRFKRISGLPFVGPLFISLGLWWSPAAIPAWIYLLPWVLELAAGFACVAVQKATRARPE